MSHTGHTQILGATVHIFFPTVTSRPGFLHHWI